MAKSNRDRVGEIMDALKAGLGPYVLREYKMVYKGSAYLSTIEEVLTSYSYSPPHLANEETALNEIDVQGWLNLMWRRWNEVFANKLGHIERSYVSELIEARNDWAHQSAFTNDDAYRVADTADRLLLAVNAPNEAEIAQSNARELLRLRFEAEQRKAQKKTAAPDGVPTTTLKGLRPWRHVIKPHPDVASGRYIQAEFAADIAQVRKGTAEPEYGDPHEFFRRTYLTEGLVTLLVTGLRRLNGIGGDPVVQLQTAFGGGKTHSMLALYHLFSGAIGISEIPGGEQIAQRVGEIDDKLTANRAVIVGTAFDASQPRVYPDVTTRTLWGDMAYQLGGVEGYKMVEQADLAGVSPGSDTLVELVDKYGPALIIIDELVAFARNLYGVTDRLPAGTFDGIMTFMQSLTEAVRRSSDSILLVSIPESDIEKGGEGGRVATEILSHTIGRIESIWKPVTATESFEIVRRRLFASEVDHAARDAVLSAYQHMYADGIGDYPSGVAEGEYFQRLRAAYPIHPELFDRLYQDWSTLERFQRTRGVLRLMAAVIHELWFRGDQSLLIMPCSIPMDAANVRDEMLRYLPEHWPAIVDTDIDGVESHPFITDKGVPTLGQYGACRRVARTIFIGSAPSVTAQSVRGVEEVRINLGTAQPGEPLAIFGDALRRLSNQLTYLYSDGTRYWYDTRPTVNRLALDRAPRIPDERVHEEIVNRLKAVKYSNLDFAGVHVAPAGPADVVDEWSARLVLLDPEKPHKRNDDTSPAMQHACDILENRGTAPRLYRNMLVFLAAGAGEADALELSIREYLAWDSINDEEEQLNLDAQQRKQVAANLRRTDETVSSRLMEAYNWLLVPEQPAPTGPIQMQISRISGSDNFYQRAARKLRQSGLLITEWSPTNLNMELERYLWRDEKHLGLKQLWNYLAQYCYLPRLYNRDVMLVAVRDGVAGDGALFGYAEGIGEDDKYQRLVYRRAGQIYFDDNSVLVRPEVAQKQIDEEEPVVIGGGTGKGKNGNGKGGGKGGNGGGGGDPVVKLKRRYHATVTLNPQRITKDVGSIVDEVIEHFTALAGTNVEITLEISATHPEGRSPKAAVGACSAHATRAGRPNWSRSRRGRRQTLRSRRRCAGCGPRRGLRPTGSLHSGCKEATGEHLRTGRSKALHREQRCWVC